MNRLLQLLFVLILVSMIGVTTWASLDRDIFTAGSELIKDRWFIATLMDAYFGFLTFFVWVAWREVTMTRRLVWFVLIMCLGNIAMSAYVIWQLTRAKPLFGESQP